MWLYSEANFLNHLPWFYSRGGERADQGKDITLPVPHIWGRQDPSLLPNINPNPTLTPILNQTLNLTLTLNPTPTITPILN